MIEAELCSHGHSTSYSLVWNLGKQIQGLAFSGDVCLEHFSTPHGCIQFERICLLEVLIWEEENQCIPSWVVLELGHCCTVNFVIAWSVSWHHPLTVVGKKGTYLLLSLAPLESRLVQDAGCPILFWFYDSSLLRIRHRKASCLKNTAGRIQMELRHTGNFNVIVSSSAIICTFTSKIYTTIIP